MPKKEIALELAEFLDSTQAAAVVDSAGSDAVRKVVGAFLTVCYEELGKRPRLLDGEDMHAALGHLLPNHFAKKDPVAADAPAILRAFIDHLKESQVVTHSFELERGFESTIDEFRETVRTGQNAHHHHHPKVDPFKHGAPKLGRNDPCSCGSGKKYKKCHGKGA